MKVELINFMGNDLTTVNAARVSFNKESDYFDYQDEKLVGYLGKHNHISPFGHAFASFRVKAPIFVARQLVKHKFLRWNEVSRRYVDDPPEFYTPDTWRGRPEKSIKQGSEGKVDLSRYAEDGHRSPESLTEHPSLEDRYHTTLKDVVALYDALLKSGVAPEQARMVLPQNMYTQWWWSGSLDAFAAMCNLRCYPDAQAETKFIADEINFEMGELFPFSWKALRNGK